MKIQRLRKKNSIDIARKLPLKCLFIA
ncbi:UNVERIFIED_CONTAM: META domain-containing protein, partial [Cronobacter sakazakii]